MIKGKRLSADSLSIYFWGTLVQAKSNLILIIWDCNHLDRAL